MENYSPESSSGSSPDSRKPDDDKESKPSSKAQPKPIVEALGSKAASIFGKGGEKGKGSSKPEPKMALPTSELKPSPTSEAKNPANEVPAATTAHEATPESTPFTSAEAMAGEISLDKVQKEAAAFIDLRRGEVQQELRQLPTDSEQANEAATDDAFLNNAAEEVNTAAPDSAFNRVIDDAYDRTMNAIHEAPDSFVPPPAAAPEQRTYVPPAVDPGEQARLHAQAQEASRPKVSGPLTGERPVGEPVDTRVAIPWYYRRGPGGISFYPESWPRPNPQKSMLEKISERVRLRRERRTAERNIGRKVEQKLDQQAESAQQYIYQKEQAIRNEVKNQSADLASKLEHKPARPGAAGAEVLPIPVPLTPEKAPKSAAMALKAEKAPVPAEAEETKLKPLESLPPAAQPAERVQRMDHRELLSISEKVVIEGVSLRRIYEGKQISELGLRRIVGEYLRGGDIKHALDQELLLKQMAYERDPQLRDKLQPVFGASASGGGATAQTQSAQAKPGQSTSKQDDASAKEDESAKRRQQKSKNPGEQVLVRAWVTAIVLLAFIAVILLLKRH